MQDLERLTRALMRARYGWVSQVYPIRTIFRAYSHGLGREGSPFVNLSKAHHARTLLG
jgi:hypothetical protein